MKLLIDVGNLRLKWAFSTQIDIPKSSNTGVREARSAIQHQVETSDFTGLEKCWERRFAPATDSELGQNVTPDTVYISSVAHDQINQRLTQICEALWMLSPIFVHSSAKTLGITNRYGTPESLGVDRWAAIIGASQIFFLTLRNVQSSFINFIYSLY